MSSRKIVHVVALPYPAQGHLLPLAHLSTKLAAAGIIVTLVNIDTIHETLSRQWKCPPGMDIRLEKVQCEIHVPYGIDPEAMERVELLLQALEKIQVSVEELVAKLQPAPCCLIADYFLPWAVNLAKRLCMKTVTFWPGNAAWSSIHHHTEEMVYHGDVFQGFVDNPICYVPGLGTFSGRHLPKYFQRRLTSGPVRDFFTASADRMKDADWILVNTISDLEIHVLDAMQRVLANDNFVPVGPLFSDPRQGVDSVPRASLCHEEMQCVEWLNTQAPRSVLYVAFGSLCVRSEEEMGKFAAGLAASGQAFLWVDSQQQLQAIESLRDFAHRVRPRGMVVSWAPQLHVLAHESTAVFLSHCGWNSVLESISCGVPLLGWPCHTEQSMNCKLVEDWKLGHRFADDGQSLERVEEKIRSAMEQGKRVKIRARMAALTNKAGSTSHANLERFIAALFD